MNSPQQESKLQLYANAAGFMVEVHGALTDPVTSCPQGGGLRGSMAKSSFEQTFRPCELPAWHKVRVSGDFLPDDLPPLEAITDGRHWNGWAMPRFTLENAKLLLAHIPDLRYDQAKNAFILMSEPPYEEEEEEVFAAQAVDFEGTPTKVYAIGAGSWCWWRLD